jgi:sugar phosphate isomerase/epimerase
MKPSVWSSYFVDLSPEEMVKVFSENGWTDSELSDEHGAALLQRGPGEKIGKEFGKFAADHGFRFTQGHLWLRCDIACEKQGEAVSALKDWLDLFHGIGIEAAVLHPGGHERLAAGADPSEVAEIRVKALRELSGHIKGTNMTICLENLVRVAPTCDELLEVINAADCPNIGICLDTGHLNINRGDQAEFIRKADSYLKALHIADNEGKSDQHMMPYGRGNVDWESTMHALKENHYSGLFNMEIPGERLCPMPIRLAKLEYVKFMADYMMEEL